MNRSNFPALFPSPQSCTDVSMGKVNGFTASTTVTFPTTEFHLELFYRIYYLIKKHQGSYFQSHIEWVIPSFNTLNVRWHEQHLASTVEFVSWKSAGCPNSWTSSESNESNKIPTCSGIWEIRFKPKFPWRNAYHMWLFTPETLKYKEWNYEYSGPDLWSTYCSYPRIRDVERCDMLVKCWGWQVYLFSYSFVCVWLVVYLFMNLFILLLVYLFIHVYFTCLFII